MWTESSSVNSANLVNIASLQTFYYFSHFLLYIVLRFVKPIPLNEYDDDKTTRVCRPTL